MAWNVGPARENPCVILETPFDMSLRKTNVAITCRGEPLDCLVDSIVRKFAAYQFFDFFDMRLEALHCFLEVLIKDQWCVLL